MSDAPHDALVPGLYEALLTQLLDQRLAPVAASGRVTLRDVDPAEAPAILARHLHAVSLRALQRVEGAPAERRRRQVAVVNALVQRLVEEGLLDGHERVSPKEAQLLELLPGGDVASGPLPRPQIPLSSSDLLVNARDEVRIGRELVAEIPTADRIDLICSFIKWKGLLLVRDALRDWLAVGGRRLRVLTTPYVGITEDRALAALAALGADVRVSYDPRRTRLHAKAWLFHRQTGFSTAYIGSSNISHSALTDGLEWNVRLAEVDAGHVVRRFRTAFESYWAEEEFQPYDSARFRRARQAARPDVDDRPTTLVELRPHPFQQEVLDQLQVERERHDRHRNLVVAATGTGKTVIAALDYARLRRARIAAGRGARLLFVAHRAEILRQSRDLFRMALQDGGFGELLVGGERPEHGHAVFASIQSLARRFPDGGPPELAADAFDIVVVDEVHHGAAPTYVRLLDHLRPAVLLGLTATPERHDGLDILPWFGGRPAAELRLWDALDRGLLCPFHYYGIDDGTDLRDVRFRWGFGYDKTELEDLFATAERSAARARVRLILQEVQDKVPDPRRMRALGFCVGVAHARFMAAQFEAVGLAARAVVGETPDDERAQALRDLRDGRVQVLFTVDLFNEGVDVPQIDTILMLRPTESATIFLQQLGRGLRLSEGKDALTVLDFVGLMHTEYRSHQKYQGLLQGVAGGLKRSVEEGFPVLPIGCAMRLDERTRAQVLASLRRSLGGAYQPVVDEVRALGPLALGALLEAFEWTPEELYRRRDEKWTWGALQAAAGFREPDHRERAARRALGGLLHVDDPVRLSMWRRWLDQDAPPDVGALGDDARRLAGMLHFALRGTQPSQAGPLAERLAALWQVPSLRAELASLLDVLDQRAAHLPVPLVECPAVPLVVHGRYQRDEVLAAFDVLDPENPHAVVSGVLAVPTHRVLLLFVTVEKSAAHYSPGTMYRDGALSRTIMLWDSPNSAGPDTPLGRQLLEHRADGTTVLFFVRRTRKDERGFTMPYTLLGPADYLDHEGDRPMAMRWRLVHEIPAWFLPEVRFVA